MAVRPRVLISASAVGYYGDRGEEELTEGSAPGDGFLARICVDWEAAAREAEQLGVRVVLARFGVVLGEGGALPRLVLPYRLFVGGRLGSGRQWMSLVHRSDVVGLIRHALEDDAISGPLNAVVPTPIRNADLARLIGDVLHRPSALPAPAAALRLALGSEMADEMLLASQRVLPVETLASGYRFRFPMVEASAARRPSELTRVTLGRMVQLRSLRAAAELVDVDERPVGPNPDRLATLESIQRRVLWLATRIVHEANNVRPNVDHAKVGGHQASSASVVSILTALYFAWLRAGDRVAVKPHASPAFHAVQYLLGNLDRRYLSKLRDFDGLQAYPSRTKDPDPVDISTGSVGLGSAATLFAALADRYAEAHFGASHQGPRRRYVALVGDAELDEGNVWEAITDATVATAKLGNVLWIVDLNRQSLDRVVPGIRAQELESLFSVAGWRVLEVKYGRRLKAAFAGRGGVALRRRVDDMANEEYQALVRLPGSAIRQQLVEGGARSVRDALAESVAQVDDADLPALLSDLGGHDLAELLTAFHAADSEVSHPTIIFAYTMKGWGLPIAGDPLNHSALLTQAQLDELRSELDVPADDDWAAFAADSAEAELCREAVHRVYPDGSRPARPRPAVSVEDVPTSLATRTPPSTSSQDAFGNALVELARLGGPLAERLVTASADVAVSTNLGGWINRQGVFATEPEPRPIDETPRLLRWQPGPHGQHIELGIAEINLFLLLGQLALSYELNGEALAAGRHGLRPLCLPRIGRADLWRLLGRALRLRRHAIGHQLEPGGRRTPEPDHALDRHGAAADRAVRALLRARDRMVSAGRAAPGTGPRAWAQHVPALDDEAGRPAPAGACAPSIWRGGAAAAGRGGRLPTRRGRRVGGGAEGAAGERRRDDSGSQRGGRRAACRRHRGHLAEPEQRQPALSLVAGQPAGGRARRPASGRAAPARAH